MALAAIVWLTPLAAFGRDKTPNPYAKFAGVYRTSADLAGAAGPLMNLSLGNDGTATVDEENGTTNLTRFGHWSDSGEQVIITFDRLDGRPAAPPMIFEAVHDGLRATTWNRAIWGKVIPPPLKKGSKVREKYWFDTVR